MVRQKNKIETEKRKKKIKSCPRRACTRGQARRHNKQMRKITGVMRSLGRKSRARRRAGEEGVPGSEYRAHPERAV